MNIVGHVDKVSTHVVVGWAADLDQPDRAIEVEIVVDGAPRATISAAACRDGLEQAFPGSTGRYQFKHEFLPGLTNVNPHRVEIVEKQTHRPLPNGVWTLTPRRPRHERMMPILLTSTGRSGTTMLMREFAHQPSIVVANTYPYEVQIASYYAATLEVLRRPRFQTDNDSLVFAESAFNDMRAMPNPWNQPELSQVVGGPYLTRFMDETVPSRLAATFRGIVLEYYDMIKVSQDKLTVGYFAEKSQIDGTLRQATRDLFGGVKEIVLVRDPRDFLCSARDFWKMTVDHSFTMLLGQIEKLRTIHAEAADDVMFVRYEDLILSPVETRERIYRFLEIDPSEVVEVPPDPDLLLNHATARDTIGSVGRWRRDLNPDDAAVCARACEDFMRTFGYA